MVKTDPVCLMTVTDQSMETFEHQGNVYYFCSHLCREVFALDPDWYLAKNGESLRNQQYCSPKQETKS